MTTTHPADLFSLPTGPRKGRGLSRTTRERLEAAIEILEDIHPATVRSVCYQLFIRRLIPSMAKNDTNKVSRLLVGARERGDIPWSWIVDQVREPQRISAWQDVQTYLRVVKRSYRRDRWSEQPRRVQVWSEKGTVAGTLQPVLDEYGVTFFPIGGYGSATNLYNAAAESLEANDRPLTVLYVGDWDPSGLHMSAVDVPSRIARYGGTIEVIRLALTASDTTVLNLPSFLASDKKDDPRYRWFIETMTGRVWSGKDTAYGARCWELDALSPTVLRDRVEQAIVARIEEPAWERAAIAEAAECESIEQLIARWPSISRQASKYPEEDR